jgi:hypothetical protein
MEEFLIGEQLWELKSDHKPICLSLTWIEKQQHGNKNKHIQQPPSKGRILISKTYKIGGLTTKTPLQP